MTRPEFEDLLKNVYLEQGQIPPFITLTPDHAEIQKSPSASRGSFFLRFAKSAENRKSTSTYWHSNPLFFPSSEKPLKGLRIALDPGHIGGKWAQLEQRWFQIEGNPPVAEGELNLTVANLLLPRLQSLGAIVELVRTDLNPVASISPETLKEEARHYLEDHKITSLSEINRETDDAKKKDPLQWASEFLAYQVSEIRERARIINEKIKPDLTLCLHFDAQRWPDPKKPSLLKHNQFHLLIPGAYSLEELQLEDIRFEMLFRLLSRSHLTELAIAQKLAPSIAALTGLLPGHYPPEAHVKKMDNSGYIWARNLLANRLYQSPVLFLEPYTMNDEEVYRRIQMGDYAGERIVGGIPRKSIFREYAEAVTAGLLSYYSHPPSSLASQ